MYAVNKRTGSPILGTLERIEGRCRIEPSSFRQKADGGLAFDDAGEGTEVFWDSAETVRGAGGLIFLDEDGTRVSAADIKLFDTADKMAGFQYQRELVSHADDLLSELNRPNWEGCTVRELVDAMHKLVHADD